LTFYLSCDRWLGDEVASKRGSADVCEEGAASQPTTKKARQDSAGSVIPNQPCEYHFDINEWKIIPSNNPKQSNAFDCGVFVILFMDLLMLGVPLLFGGDDIPLTRKKLTLQILNARLEKENVVHVD